MVEAHWLTVISVAPEANIMTKISQKRRSCRSGRMPLIALFSAATSGIGEQRNKNALQSGRIAHRQQRMRQFPIPNRRKNSVESSTTATWPQLKNECSRFMAALLRSVGQASMIGLTSTSISPAPAE